MRTWLAIPIGGACAAAAGAIAAHDPIVAAAAGLAGAAMVAAVRALVGDSPAAIAGALAAAAILVATLVDVRAASPRELLAAAAFAWAIAELANAHQPASSPIVALLPALVAAALDVAFVPLVAIVGARLVTAPWARPRWIVVVPIAGAIAAALGSAALIASALAGEGWLPRLAALWTGRAAHPISPAALATALPEALNPFVTVAALAGLAALAGRGRHVQLAAGTVLALALVSAARAGIAAPVVTVAALSAGLAITRLAATIRVPSGQAITAATLGLISLAPPVLVLAMR